MASRLYRNVYADTWCVKSCRLRSIVVAMELLERSACSVLMLFFLPVPARQAHHATLRQGERLVPSTVQSSHQVRDRMGDIFCGSKRGTVHDGRGNLYHVYISTKSRLKNCNAVLWPRNNFKNSTKPTGTIPDDRGKMYRVYI